MSLTHEHGGNVFALARSLGIAPEALLDFSASINPLGMAPGVSEAIRASLESLMHYPDKGAFELKERLADYHGIAAGELTVANGSTELIHLLPRVIPGKKGLIVAPAFAEYEAALRRAGWEIDYLELAKGDGFALSVEALSDRLRGGYDMLFICNPANPTGCLLKRSQIEEILAVCRECGTFLVLDEAFIDFCEEESAKELLVQFERGVLLRSMTKFFAIPGLRLGYAIGAAATIETLASFQDPWSVNTAAQVAGIASLRDAGYRTATREYVAAQRAALREGLDRLGWVRSFPSHANYLLAEIQNGLSASQLRKRLMQHGVLIRDCANFRGLNRHFFRVAVRLEAENERLLQLLSEAWQ